MRKDAINMTGMTFGILTVCRWSTPEEQGSNKINNVWIECFGMRPTISQWARKIGIKRTTLSARYLNNWPVEKMLTKGV